MFTRLFQDIASFQPATHGSQRLFRVLLNSIVDYGIGTLDVNGHVTSWNTAAQELTGYDADYVLGKHFSTLFPDGSPETDDEHWLALQEAAETGRFVSEVSRPNADGTDRRIELIVTPARDTRGTPQAFVILLREPVEQRETTTAQNARNASFELLVNSVEDYAILMLDTEGRIASWNTGAEKLEGYKANEVMGHDLSLFYTAEDNKQGRAQRNLDIAAANGRFEGEGWRVRKDGSLFWANVVITALRDKSGRLRGYGKVTRDLTHHYRATIAPLQNGVMLLGPDGTTFACNESACRLLDVPERMLLGRRLADLDAQVVRENGTAIRNDELPAIVTLSTGTPCHDVVLGIRHRDNTTHWVSVDTGVFELDKAGHPSAVIMSMHDISQLKQSHDAIRRGEQLFRSLVAASAQIVWEAGPDGAFRYISSAFETLTGKPPEQTQDWGWLSALPATDRVRVKKAWHDARIRGTRFELECRLRLQDKTTRFFLMRGVPLKSDDNRIREWIGTLSDINARKQYEQELEYKAHYDELTGLANRSVLTDRLKQAIAHSSRAERMVAVLFLDIDNFKGVNDDLGHQHGDTVLRNVAKRLMDGIRSGDTVARVGGDEFVIVLTQLHDADDVRRFYSKLRRTLAKPIAVADRLYTVTVSIGAAVSPTDGTAVTDLLRHADLAMYHVKQQGRNGLAFYQSDMDAPQVSAILPDRKA
ncbi:MAG: diguanylate cyclase domain-containing protein [Gammaproteobacteria bacterium]